MLRTMTSLANRLLDAQVAWAVAQLTGPGLADLVARDVDDVLATTAHLRLDALVEPDEVKRVARRLVATVPSSAAAGELVRAATDVVLAGPDRPFALQDLIGREHVEAILTEVLGATHLAQDALDHLAASPLVGTVASRFVGRLVGEVLQANRAVAEKVPGLGALMSFGTGAASKMMGAADKQFEALLGDTAGKGTTFAVRRLNKIVLETLQDPTTRAAALEVWDLYAAKPIGSLTAYVEAEDAHRLVDLVRAAVAEASATEPAAELVDSLVDAFFGVYGASPLGDLLDGLAISRDDLVADATALATTAVDAARESGRLEELVRARLEPFFTSPEVAAILGEG